jgi:hypothetical protein
MGPYAGVDYNLTVCPLQSQLQHIYHGQLYAMQSRPEPYVRVDFIHPVRDFGFGICCLSDVIIVFPYCYFVPILSSHFFAVISPFLSSSLLSTVQYLCLSQSFCVNFIIILLSLFLFLVHFSFLITSLCHFPSPVFLVFIVLTVVPPLLDRCRSRFGNSSPFLYHLLSWCRLAESLAVLF